MDKIAEEESIPPLSSSSSETEKVIMTHNCHPVVQQDNPFFQNLNPFESYALVEILSELDQQLILYDSIISSKVCSDQVDIEIKGSRGKGKVCKCGDNSINLNQPQKLVNPLIQLEGDLQVLLKTVKDTKSELEMRNRFSSTLCLNRRNMDESEQDEKLSISTELDIKQEEEIIRKLEKAIKEWEESCKIRNMNQLCLINELKDQIHLEKLKGEKDCNFAQVWLTAQNEFTSGVLHKNEISDRKLQIKRISENEERDCESYENVVAWTKLRCCQLEKEIQQWKEKLASDLDKMKIKVEEKQENIADQEKQIIALQELIHHRVEELIPWEEEKQQERLERIQHMRRYYSCRKLQRWWRKYMVHHGLYKKKKVKAKPKQKGKVKSPRAKKKSL